MDAPFDERTLRLETALGSAIAGATGLLASWAVLLPDHVHIDVRDRLLHPTQGIVRESLVALGAEDELVNAVLVVVDAQCPT
jgi:hypothetical protein